MVATAVVMVATAVVIMVATAVVIPNLIVLTLVNLLEQKVGKTEVTEILPKTLNLKVVGAGEKGECPTMVMLQTRQIRNPFLQAL